MEQKSNIKGDLQVDIWLEIVEYLPLNFLISIRLLSKTHFEFPWKGALKNRWFCFNIDEVMSTFPKDFSCVTCLKIVDSYSKVKINEFIHIFKGINQISLKNTRIDRKGLQILVENNENLEFLSLENCNFIDDQDLEVCKGVKKVKYETEGFGEFT